MCEADVSHSTPLNPTFCSEKQHFLVSVHNIKNEVALLFLFFFLLIFWMCTVLWFCEWAEIYRQTGTWNVVELELLGGSYDWIS